MAERTLTLPDPVERANLAAFLGRAVRLDPAAVVRIRRRGEQRLTIWCTTAGFDSLAVRVIGGRSGAADICVAADGLLAAVEATLPPPGEDAGAQTGTHTGGPIGAEEAAVDGTGEIEPGFSMDSAWRGSLPPDTGFVHVDDVPARELVDLAVQGAALAREHSTSQGPPRSLLDQSVLTVEGTDDRVEVPLRCVFALTAMGFVPDVTQDPRDGTVDASGLDAREPVRVRVGGPWLRLDARYGSVCYRRSGGLSLDVL